MGAVKLPRQSSPRMRKSTESQFEVGRHAGGQREEYRHGIPSHLNEMSFSRPYPAQSFLLRELH
jgi:hypothetical protein